MVFFFPLCVKWKARTFNIEKLKIRQFIIISVDIIIKKKKKAHPYVLNISSCSINIVLPNLF